MNINLSLNKLEILGREWEWLSKLKESASTQHIYLPCSVQIRRVVTARAIRKRKVFNSNIFHIIQLLNYHGKIIHFFIKYAFLDFFQMFFFFSFFRRNISSNRHVFFNPIIRGKITKNSYRLQCLSKTDQRTKNAI